jgi:FkbM family methyltransferase
VEELKPGNLFFDIGANIGYFTTLGSRLVGPRGGVIAFEPMARNLLYLNRHIVMNKLGNVSIVAAACSDSHQIATFAAGPNCAQGQLRNEEEDWIPGGDMFLAPTVTVDAVSALIKRYPDVIKIDVEGAELLVLSGARKTLQEGKPRVLLEVHSDSLKIECRDFLGRLGYVWETLDVEADRPLEMLFRPS